MNELELHHNPYMEKIADTKLAVGSEAYRHALRIYNSVKELAKNDSAFETIRIQLAQRFNLLTGPKPRTATQTLAIGPGSSVSVINVVEGSAVKNIGTYAIMVCPGTIPVCTLGALLEPGQSMNLATGVVAITVTNQSSSIGASFTVKTVSAT